MQIVERISERGVEALRERLLPEPPPLPLVARRSDYDLAAHLVRPDAAQLAPAAVLVPIVRRAEPTVLFTRRTAHLARHAGQVSFPGGRMHESDPSLADTALRETQEETGIAPEQISIAGFLDAYETRTGFIILPVVGLLAEGFRLTPNEFEVASVFEVPLVFLLDHSNCELHSVLWQGVQRTFYAFTYETHFIWGATAGILVNLRERLCS
jgi:8-oxo-dGTP pyrophosphatase MutT (NUDIX family)